MNNFLIFFRKKFEKFRILILGGMVIKFFKVKKKVSVLLKERYFKDLYL